MSTEQSPTVEKINRILTAAGEAHECGELERAARLYKELLSYGDHPLLRYNLGLIHYELGDYKDAQNSFKAGLAMVPQDQDMLFNLALSYGSEGEIEKSIATYLKILELNPDHIDANYNLANIYRADQRFLEAVSHYKKAIDCDSSHAGSINNIAYCFQRIDEPENALEYYTRLLELRPGDPAALHMVAALTGESVDKPHEDYVKDVFDKFSSHYDSKLVDNLQYKVPTQLLTLIRSLDSQCRVFSSGLDLGCGTGLSGDCFKDVVGGLDGVDLSANMVALAAAKGIYENLYVEDLESYLEQCRKSYDLFIAADVFTYIGNLTSIFSMARTISAEKGIFCFSTEHSQSGEFTIQKTGRYAHNPDYIKELAASNQWNVLKCEMANIRMEEDAWIRGNLWVLQALS